jgi:hypothetical protein
MFGIAYKFRSRVEGDKSAAAVHAFMSGTSNKTLARTWFMYEKHG